MILKGVKKGHKEDHNSIPTPSNEKYQRPHKCSIVFVTDTIIHPETVMVHLQELLIVRLFVEEVMKALLEAFKSYHEYASITFGAMMASRRSIDLASFAE